jgi:aminopeptidase N
LLKLPTQADVARLIGKNVDPALIHRAHRQLSKLIGRTLGPLLEELYVTMAEKGDFSPDAESAGRRALRNAALTLLSARGTREDAARLGKHYFKATNMTDRRTRSARRAWRLTRLRARRFPRALEGRPRRDRYVVRGQAHPAPARWAKSRR